MPDPIIKEDQFWLQVMGDYARFLRNTIYVTAADEINRSAGFITQLANYLHDRD
jgi:hypothetical protein